MRQNLAFTFDSHGGQADRPGQGAPARTRPVRTVPSFVRVPRDHGERPAERDQAEPMHRTPAVGRRRDGSRR